MYDCGHCVSGCWAGLLGVLLLDNRANVFVVVLFFILIVKWGNLDSGLGLELVQWLDYSLSEQLGEAYQE